MRTVVLWEIPVALNISHELFYILQRLLVQTSVTEWRNALRSAKLVFILYSSLAIAATDNLDHAENKQQYT
jgi:hypothetical protein